MHKINRTTKDLKILLESGLEIIESRNLYNAWEKIPKHQAGSFNEMFRQSHQPKIYEDWWNNVEKAFSDNGLNFLKLKNKVFTLDSSVDYGIGHATRLKNGVEIIERMTEDKDFLESYMRVKKHSHQIKEVVFDGKTVKQGPNKHKFTNDECIKVLRALWKGRGAVLLDGEAISSPDIHSWDEFDMTPDSLRGTAQSINKAMRESDISLRVKYPKRIDGLMLMVTQAKYTNK